MRSNKILYSAITGIAECSTHLRRPPPFACVHIEVYLHRLSPVGVVLFWNEEEQGRELGITEQSTNAFEDVPEVHLERLASYDNFLAYEPRPTRGEFVDDGIEFARVLVRKRKALSYLKEDQSDTNKQTAELHTPSTARRSLNAVEPAPHRALAHRATPQSSLDRNGA